MTADMETVTALWGAVIVSGVYHGISPGMGWPLAVSAALMEDRRLAMLRALAALGVGHFLAMTAILAPFSLVTALVVWQMEIRLVAGVVVAGMGGYLLINRRHPRFLARVPPARLALWSFLAATAHGAGLMLAPIYLGIYGGSVGGEGHEAVQVLLGRNLAGAFFVALIHSFFMTAASGAIAAAVYFWLGLRFLSRGWFNLDVVWALSLVIVGLAGIFSAYHGHGHGH